MSGSNDLGGRPGFGPVAPEPGEPVFHQPWEARVFALNFACRHWGLWNLDMMREACESMPPERYVRANYYEIWLWGIERLLEKHGVLSGPGPAEPRVLKAGRVWEALGGRDSGEPGEATGRFKPGDAVRARDVEPAGHTRLPGYCRGKRGTIHLDLGAWPLPDAGARGRREIERLYSVRFCAQELWGEGRHFVHVDMWDGYLEPA